MMAGFGALVGMAGCGGGQAGSPAVYVKSVLRRGAGCRLACVVSGQNIPRNNYYLVTPTNR